MAALTALQRLMASPKTARFVETLRHADLPTGWADDPEIVSMAGDAYRELGTGSPFWKAYEQAVGSADNPGGVLDSVYHGTRKNFDTFNTAAGRQLDDVRDAVRTPIFFSPSREFADVFANAPGPGEAQIYEGWVRPKKTFDYENQEQLKDVLNNVKAGSFEDKIFLRNTIPSGAWKVIEGPEVQTALKNLGYDSYRTAEGGKKNIAIFDPKQFKSVNNRGTFNPADPNIYRGLIPLMAAGGALAAMSPGSAQASEAEWPKQGADGRLVWPADMPGYRNTEPGLEAPLIDPVDIATAPIGMTTAAGKALAMAAEPGLAYGTDKALGAMLGLFQRNKRTGGGGGV